MVNLVKKDRVTSAGCMRNVRSQDVDEIGKYSDLVDRVDRRGRQRAPGLLVDTVAGAWVRGRRKSGAQVGERGGVDRQKMTETLEEDGGGQAKMSHARARDS